MVEGFKVEFKDSGVAVTTNAEVRWQMIALSS
jgi:hypothetical protein